jgi:acylphosphatase
MSAEADTTVRAHAIVSGRVQRVYFRASTAHEARALGLSGWVRNAGDEVEAVFEGARPAVERMLRWCSEGPPGAAVDHVAVRWEEPEGLTGFGIRS